MWVTSNRIGSPKAFMIANRMTIAGVTLAAVVAPVLFQQSDAERGVRAFQAQRFEAMVRHDVDAVAACLAEDLTYAHTDGDTETKTQFIQTLRAGRLKYDGIEPTDIIVRAYGDVAVVTGRSTMHVRSAEQAQILRIKFLEVDRWSGFRWQMVAWQATRLSP
jgi:ketosteroid isomerase-like protein